MTNDEQKMAELLKTGAELLVKKVCPRPVCANCAPMKRWIESVNQVCKKAGLQPVTSATAPASAQSKLPPLPPQAILPFPAARPAARTMPSGMQFIPIAPDMHVLPPSAIG